MSKVHRLLKTLDLGKLRARWTQLLAKRRRKRQERHPPETVELGKLWARWTQLLDRQLNKRRRLIRVSEANYAAAHHALLTALEEALEEPEDASPLDKATLNELHEFCQAWISLEALQAADGRVAIGLVKRSEELCFENFGLKPTSRLVTHAIQLVAATCVLTIVLAGTVGKSGTLLWNSGVSTELRSHAYRLWYSLGQYTGLEWLGIATGLVVILGIWMLSSTRDW